MEARLMVLKGGSPALHMLGDIGRDDDDFIHVTSENETEYIGMFLEGLGCFGVRFQKSDVRPCTKEEIDNLNQCYFAINNNVYYKNNYNYDGTWGSGS